MKKIKASCYDSKCSKYDIMEQLEILTEEEIELCWENEECLNVENIEILWNKYNMPKLEYEYDAESDDMSIIYYINV